MAENYSILQKDFYRESGKWLSPFQIWAKCINPNLHFIYVLRKSQQYLKTPLLNIFWKLALRHYQIKYGFQIYPETEIGEGFYLGHWGSLVINPNAKIGKNCNIAQGVTIGQQNRGKIRDFQPLEMKYGLEPMPLSWEELPSETMFLSRQMPT